MNHKIFISKILCPLLALLLTFGLAQPAIASEFPQGWPAAPEIANETGILMEAETGQVLFGKGMDEVRYPASTTKAMTTLLILENCRDLNEKVTFTDVILPDLEPGNSTINAQVGEELTVEQCLYAIMLASANEVCTQMAVKVAGSVNNFTAMMNKRAAELGCQNTNFVNANGLPDPNHYTTAHDLALILAEAVKNENFCKVAGAAEYTIPATNKTSWDRNLKNSNALLTEGKFYYESAVAGKTGHTEAAKNTLVTAARRDDMTLICVVMRSDGDDRFTDTIKLFDYGFDNFHKEPVYWLNAQESQGYAVLPNGVSVNKLVKKDQDHEGVRTHTYYYQGKEILSISAQLPIQTEARVTSDMSMFKTGIQEKTFVSPFLFPVMIVIFVILCIVLTVIIVREILDSRRQKTGKKKKA